jgi:diaminopimelate epimerase
LIPFTKAHACGNDFLIVAESDLDGHDPSTLAIALCDRNTGLGADGVEFLDWQNEDPARGPLAATIRLYNADGSLAEISGNGTRCVAAWMAYESNAQPGDTLLLHTDAGLRNCTLNELREAGSPTALITTDMDIPDWEPRVVELADGSRLDGVFVSLGNPHFVLLVSNPPQSDGSLDFSIDGRPWQEIGEEICFHPDFPDQTNVEFVQPLSRGRNQPDQVALRIFERGVGPTHSSGTGTSAAATAMIAAFGAASWIEVFAPGGMQTVRWPGANEPLLLTGPATLIARGEAWAGKV